MGSAARAPAARGTAGLRLVLQALTAWLLVLGPGACLPPTGASEGASTAAGSGGVNAPEHRDAPYVVLVSLDGFRHDYLDLHPAPALGDLARRGVRADALIPVFPTKTFPTHYSIATGMYADKHGLVANTMWDPERRAWYSIGDRRAVEDGTWYRGEPIWVTAETQGMVTASYFFVGTEADVQGVRPTFWRSYDGSIPNMARVDQVLEWLALPADRRPHLVTLYFSDTDDAGHDYGPLSPETAQAVARVDAAVGRLLEGLAELPHGSDVYVIVVSDHGMMSAPADRFEVVDPDLFPGTRLVSHGPFANLFIEAGGAGRAPQVRDSVAALLPHGAVYLRHEVPARYHYRDDPRIGDVVIIMQPGWNVTTPGKEPESDAWTHGWDNRTPEMGALFVAAGPGIQPGQRLPAFESVHIYPFVAHLLGLRPNPAVDGRLSVLAPVLAPAGARE